MAASFRCPKCQMIFRVEESALGKSVICPNPACGQKTVLPKSGKVNKLRNEQSQQRCRDARQAAQKMSSSPINNANTQKTQHITTKTPISRAILLISGFVSCGVALLLILGGIATVHHRSGSMPVGEASVSLDTDDLQDQTQSLATSSSSAASLHPGQLLTRTIQQPQSLIASGSNEVNNEVQKEEVASLLNHPETLTVEQVVARTDSSIALIRGRRSSGSGFVVWNGIVATNRHVVKNEETEHLMVYFPNASVAQRGPHRVQVLYIDPERDLAFLRVNASIKPLLMAEQHTFIPRQQAVMIGNPSGVEGLILHNEVRRGEIVAAVTHLGQKYYQMNFFISHETSGGPILNSYGEVIGVSTMMKTTNVPTKEPMEAWLYEMLEQPIPLIEFPGEVPLKEVLDFLAVHYTNIYGNEGAESGPDFRMTFVPDLGELIEKPYEDYQVKDITFSGIKLKNLLAIIFAQTNNGDDPELTFIVRNEVLLITTVESETFNEEFDPHDGPVHDSGGINSLSSGSDATALCVPLDEMVNSLQKATVVMAP